MFQCLKCGLWHSQYDYKTHSFHCDDCGFTLECPPKVQECTCCHEEYVEYTWFDPSGCPNCHRSFVD